MKKILIVEDQKSISQLLIKQFQDAGFDVQGALDAMVGTKLCAQWHPDLVILDVMIPAGGGMAILRYLRQSSHGQSIPVIVLTGTENPTLHKSIAEYNVVCIIQKPHHPAQLMERVKSELKMSEPTL